MKNTKLVKLLKSFSKSEIVKFADYVRSPYYNKNRNVIALAEEVLLYYPDFDDVNFSEEMVHDKIFKGVRFDYFRIKNIISDLYSLGISFLKTRHHESREIENDIDLLNEFHERQLDALYAQKEKRVSEQLSRAIKDERYYYERYLLAKVNTSHYKFEKSGYSFNQIQNEFDTFLDYSLTGLLRLYAKMLHNKNHGNINFNMEMFESVRDYIKDKDFEGNPSCRIYKQIIELELRRDEKDYRTLISLKDKYKDEISPEDMYYILLIANSFSVYRLRLGDETYYQERFLINKEVVERGFTPPSYMLYANFISYYTSACIVDEFEWAADFERSYRDGISPPEEKQNSLNYCHGFKAFRLNDFDKALEFFSKTNFKFYLFKVMVKSHTARIFYEKNMYEQTIAAADAFRHYLRSEKLMTEEQKSAHYEFLRYLVDISTLKFEDTKKNIDEELMILRKRIDGMSSNPLGAKNWLKRKVEEMNPDLRD